MTWLTVHRLSECQFRAASHKHALPKSLGSTSRWYVLEAGGGKWSIADSWPSPDITFAEVIILSLLLAFPTLFLTRRPFYTCSNLHADWLVQVPLFPSRKVRSLGRSEDPPKRRPPPFLVSTWYALFRCHDTDAKFRPAVLNLLGCFDVYCRQDQGTDVPSKEFWGRCSYCRWCNYCATVNIICPLLRRWAI